MSLKDTTVYDKLKADNWEEWEQNTLNLLDTKHLQEYTKVDYGPAIERSKEYCCLRQQEVLNFATSSSPSLSSSRKDSASSIEGEKATTIIKKASDKVTDLVATINLLRSVKGDGAPEQVQ